MERLLLEGTCLTMHVPRIHFLRSRPNWVSNQDIMATSWVILGATCCQLRIYCIQIAPLSKSPFSPQDSSTEWPSSWGMDDSTWGQGWAEYLAPSIILGGPKAPNVSRRKKLAPSRIIVFIQENNKLQEKACPSMTPSTPLRPHPLCAILGLIHGMFSSILSAIITHLGPLSPIMCHLAARLWHVLGHLGRQHRTPWAHETPKMADPTHYVPSRAHL